jgi:hypothetical protein
MFPETEKTSHFKNRKESLALDVPKIDTLSFSYYQTDFRKSKPNTSNFDCEAFVVADDSIYLFTKQWKQKRTAVYALPKIPGNHVAQLKESYNIKGLLPAPLICHKIIALSGSKMLLFILYDYNNSSFPARERLNCAFHQVEGCYQHGLPLSD